MALKANKSLQHPRTLKEISFEIVDALIAIIQNSTDYETDPAVQRAKVTPLVKRARMTLGNHRSNEPYIRGWRNNRVHFKECDNKEGEIWFEMLSYLHFNLINTDQGHFH